MEQNHSSLIILNIIHSFVFATPMYHTYHMMFSRFFLFSLEILLLTNPATNDCASGIFVLWGK